jgi:serine-type D-Ala-D-Ala carboxypeptidase (penicillin-binding protein 5/6)
VLTSWINSRNWRCSRPAAGGLGVATVLASAALLASSPAQARPAPATGSQATAQAGYGGTEAAARARYGGTEAAARARYGGTEAAAGARYSAPPPLSLRGADLVDASTGRQLWSKDANVPRPMGSITKVMTALVVLKAGGLDREITVTEGAVSYVQKDGASSAGLIAGDTLTARQLLEAMLLPSGCDAAYMLATAYGPGRLAFVQKMNAMAKAMGLTHTHFSWFDGMPYPTELSTYSSPADLIRIGERAMRNSLFRSIVAQRSYYLPATDLHHSYLWYTTDEMLGTYPGAIGIKTGDTQAAGNCLLFEARRDGHTLIGVVLHANPSSDPGSAFPAAEQLLNWGFHQF